MKEIKLTIEALSPLAIGRQKPGGSVSEAWNYIPGTSIRGAIAGQILRQLPSSENPSGELSGDFDALFIGEEAAIFSNAYPTVEGQRSLVLPATVISSKTNPGFKDKGNGVFDTLIDRFCAEGYGYIYDPNCPVDGGRVEPFGGFYSVDNGKYQSHSVTTRLLTRVGINRRRATAQEQILYSIEVINEKQIIEKEWQPSLFSSTISLESEILAKDLVNYIQSQAQNLRLGGSTSRGLGKVKIQVEVGDRQLNVRARVEEFNKKLRDRWQTWGSLSLFGTPQHPLLEKRTFFTLDLQSDAILREQWRRTTVISPEMLCQMAGIKDSQLQLYDAHSSYDYLSGWNAAWGLMKDVELIVNKGAVYLFGTEDAQFYDRWLLALERLECKGVGERTSEGFGQVQICNEFHQVFREDAV